MTSHPVAISACVATGSPYSLLRSCVVRRLASSRMRARSGIGGLPSVERDQGRFSTPGVLLPAQVIGAVREPLQGQTARCMLVPHHPEMALPVGGGDRSDGEGAARK